MIALRRVTAMSANHLSDCKNLNVFKCYRICLFGSDSCEVSVEYNKVPAELPDSIHQKSQKKIPMLSSPLPFPQLPPSYSFWVEKLPKTVSRENIQFRVMTKIIQNKFIVRNCHLKN